MKSSRSGITLTELLIATALVGIVMLGVAGFSVTVKQLQESTGKTTLLASQATAAFIRINRDVAKTTGDTQNKGYWEDISDPRYTTCFRYDKTDPASYMDDKWVCYEAQNAGQQQVKRCDELNATTTTCPVGSEILVSLYQNLAITPLFAFVEDAYGRLDYFDVHLTLIANHNQPRHPITNPTYTLTSHLDALIHGR